MTLYDVPAPAKLNLFLHIVGRRADGYHLLQSAFRFIDLCDELSFEARGDGVIERDYALEGVTPEQDLIVRAARSLQAATGTPQGARIGLRKRIPQGGGLGGGSSDAATTLVALNRLWGCGLSRRELMALALPLGADVPVFVFGQAAFAEGVGEELQPLTLPPAAYLVLQPPVSVPTSEIFSAPDLTRDSKRVRITDFLALPTSGFGQNDMQAAVFQRYPVVRDAAEILAALGIPVRMSGSGACLFAEFANLSAAKKAEADLAKLENTAIMRGAGRKISDTQTSVKLEFRLIKACAGLNEHPLKHWIAK